VELTVLGSHGTWPDAGGATTGYLLSHDGFRLWLDLGTGTMANLLGHIGLLDVDAVVISHRHPDHLLDLYPYFFARLFHPDRPLGLPLYVPPGAFDHIRALLSDQGGEEMATVFEARTVDPGEEFEAGPFRFRTAPMEHPVPTLGMRIEADGSVLAYTADTGPAEAVVRLSREADVLLSEATWLEVPTWASPIHLTAGQAGEHATRAGVGRLVLTHVRWIRTRLDEGIEQAGHAFAGPVSVAEQGLRVRL
jgi:ribonuclease BN (tRNA processing enzyme)